MSDQFVFQSTLILLIPSLRHPSLLLTTQLAPRSTSI